MDRYALGQQGVESSRELVLYVEEHEPGSTLQQSEQFEQVGEHHVDQRSLARTGETEQDGRLAQDLERHPNRTERNPQGISDLSRRKQQLGSRAGQHIRAIGTENVGSAPEGVPEFQTSEEAEKDEDRRDDEDDFHYFFLQMAMPNAINHQTGGRLVSN